MPTNEDIVTPVPGIENLTYEDVNTLLNIQKVWFEIFQWIRNYYRSVLENRQDQSAIATYLFVKLPGYTYNEFKKYYSEEDSQQLLNYIYRFITGLWQLVTAYKNNDKLAIDLSTSQLHQVSDELAVFLAKVNNLDETQLKTILHDYLSLTIEGIIAYFNGNYDLETEIYNETADKVLRLASYMAMGIITKRHMLMP